jgi:catechol 2,3-dioxygenase-like lactoylglutathione lyase family enzyme
MSLHGLTSITLGVPNVDAVASYYEDFGLRGVGDRPGRGLVFATADGGEQLALRPAGRRRLLEISIGADDLDDVGRVGSLDQEASQRFFTEGLGFKVSDRVPGLASFMRCSTDHHNLLVQQAPVNFLHHTAWEVDDIDEVGRGATAMLEGHPERHVWGLGRHHIGSNFFWYLKDPVGNFSEYYSDLDIILDDQLWKPSVVEGARGLYNWGPPPPPSFIHPEDLAALMTGSHAPDA